MSDLFSILAPTLLWAGLSTAIVLSVGVPVAYVLARREFPGSRILSALTSLPLVLPPTAAGYLLLRLLADEGLLGRETLGFDPGILLTWKAVVLACSVMSMPLVIRAARVSFAEVDPGLEAIARTLGLGPIGVFFRVTLPLARRGLVAAAVLGFARAVGEFGATVILAGNIPGRTQTIASAIFGAQQAGNQDRADLLTLVALAVGFLAILAAEWLAGPVRATRRLRGRKGGRR